MIDQAFYKICKQFVKADPVIVSLYEMIPFYGGPEEGGWWGHDFKLVAYQEFSCPQAAETVEKRIEKLARIATNQKIKEFGDHCLKEWEWCQRHGLDADFLQEPDGHSEYFVIIEETPGSLEHRGSRVYE